MKRIGIKVAGVLHAFIEEEALPGTGVAPDAFWNGLAGLVRDLAPRNRDLLDRRDELQSRIDAYHRANAGKPFDAPGYERFLREIGYLLPGARRFHHRTENVDAEIARIAGPQLVVPVTNARYALNAANARWGSLYDALYGTDAIPEDGGADARPRLQPGARRKVIAWARDVLDEAAPLADGSHARRDRLRGRGRPARRSRLQDGGRTGPAATRRSSSAIAATPATPSAVLLRNNGLHIEIVIDRAQPDRRRTIRPASPTWCSKSALTTIDGLARTRSPRSMPRTRSLVYRNWLGLMKGDLTASFDKGGRTVDAPPQPRPRLHGARRRRR